MGADRRAWYDRRKVARAEAEIQLGQTLTAYEMAKRGCAVRQDGSRRSIFEWARFPEVGPAHISELMPSLANLDADLRAEILADAHYAPYLERNKEAISD